MFYEFIRHISVSVLLHAERNGMSYQVNHSLFCDFRLNNCRSC